MFQRKRINVAVLLALGASFAQAQTQAPTDDSAKLERVVVTGSMIPRTSSETAEAMTVISADTLRQQGVTTVEQALQQLTANQSSVVTASAVSSWATGGGSFASLRGLGASKTLVLLDGQRLANSVVTGSAVDLNGIPFAAIDHIEVVREGASSIYGTDAIAGVINFITKKDYEGGEMNVGASTTQEHGGDTRTADIAYGKGNLLNDGYNLLFSANYAQTKELVAQQRSFAATGFNPAKGLANQNGPMGTFPASYEDANGNTFQVGYPTCAGNPYLTKTYGNCAYLYSAAVDLIPPSDQASGLVSFTKSLPGDNTLNVQYFYTRSKVTTWGGPQEYSFTMTPSADPTYFPTAANSTYTGTGTATPDLNAPITVGWTDPNNNRYQTDVNTERRLLTTLTGSLNGWDYSTALNYSINRNSVSSSGGYADYSVLAPGGVLSDLINPFGAQTPQGQALINGSYLNGELAAGQLSTWDFNGHASHEVGDWFHAGRPAVLALGYDLRGEHISYSSTPLAATLYDATYYPPASITGSRNEQALYGELNVPVTKQLEFTVSDREDRYSDFGATNNAKVSFRFQPSKLVTFRGAASTGFRAPSLVDLYAPQTLGAAAGSMTGPQCPTGGGTIFTASNCQAQGMALYGGNTKLKPETSDNYDLGMVLAPARDLGITLDWYKITIKNEIQTIPDTAIYSNPTQFSSLYVLNNANSLTQAPLANTACANGPSTPTCGYVLLNTQNTGGIKTSGFDLSANYLLRTSIGRFRIGMEGTWVTQYEIQEYTGAPWLSLRGQFNAGNQPAITWQHTLTVDWTNGDWGAGISNHYLSHYTDEFADANGNSLSVGSYSVWNAYASWKATSALSLTLGVRNLLNTNPPFSNQTQNWQGGYNPVFSDPTDRAYYAKARYEF